LSVQCYT